MPSVSKPQATLMAMAAHNPAFARKKGIPLGVARDFNRADKRTGILKKAAGGRTPAQAGIDAKRNFGMGEGHSMFSNMPLMGHALSGTQLGQADGAIRKAGHILARFADGGSVKKPVQKGPSAKERKEIRAIVERGKQDAVSALHSTRDALLASAPSPREPKDVDTKLANLRSRLANKPVEPRPDVGAFADYATIMDQLQNPGLDEAARAQMIARMTAIENA
jgi:hypothetical protein